MFFSNPWEHVNFDRRNSFRCSSGLFLHTLRMKTPFEKLTGKKMLFISDLHIRSGRIFCPEMRKSHLTGTEWIHHSLSEIFAHAMPDFFIFGGDLIESAVWIPDSMAMLRHAVPRNIPRIQIPGNWEINRESFLKKNFWKHQYENIGFHYLQNSGLDLNPLFFYGFDDFKFGSPSFHSDVLPDSRNRFNCILTHNPDTVPMYLSERGLADVPLILTGHTHGGQVRIPLFGAVKTSSRFRKRFERGLYRHRKTGTWMFVSSGVGVTGIAMRLFCPPEALIIEFVPE